MVRSGLDGGDAAAALRAAVRWTDGGPPPAHASDAAPLRSACLALEEEPGGHVQPDQPRREVRRAGILVLRASSQARAGPVGNRAALTHRRSSSNIPAGSRPIRT